MTTNDPRTGDCSGPGRLFTLRNERDMAVTISERGAALVSWRAPDRYGRLADVVIPDPHGTLDEALLAGRSRDRGKGVRRLDPAAWQGVVDGHCVSLRQKAGHDAAGTLTAEVRYWLDDDGRLRIEQGVSAREDAIIDLGAQPRFNLNGGRGEVGDHMLQIDADYYLKIDRHGVPLGVAPVAGTAFDFRKPAAIGPRMCWPDEQIGLAGGFGHCYGLGVRAGGQALRAVAEVRDPRSGRRLQVATTEAGLSFCIGSHPVREDGVAFRLQPCSHPEQLGGGLAAAVILCAGRQFRRTTVYELSLQP